MPKLSCEHHAQATLDYLTCVHVMNGEPISLFEEARERTPSKDGEAGIMVCSFCAELDEKPLLANTTLICGNCADRLMQIRILSGDRLCCLFLWRGLLLVLD
jgi:hypothetical protein